MLLCLISRMNDIYKSIRSCVVICNLLSAREIYPIKFSFTYTYFDRLQYQVHAGAQDARMCVVSAVAPQRPLPAITLMRSPVPRCAASPGNCPSHRSFLHILLKLLVINTRRSFNVYLACGRIHSEDVCCSV